MLCSVGDVRGGRAGSRCSFQYRGGPLATGFRLDTANRRATFGSRNSTGPGTPDGDSPAARRGCTRSACRRIGDNAFRSRPRHRLATGALALGGGVVHREGNRGQPCSESAVVVLVLVRSTAGNGASRPWSPTDSAAGGHRTSRAALRTGRRPRIRRAIGHESPPKRPGRRIAGFTGGTVLDVVPDQVYETGATVIASRAVARGGRRTGAGHRQRATRIAVANGAGASSPTCR